MQKVQLFTLLLFSQFSVLFSQKPPVLTTNAPAYNYAISIAENFNAGRRFEETNKGLTAGSLGNLVLPTNYASLTLAQKALFLINAERTCRNGVNYGSGALVVRPLQAVETNLSQIAQAHAEWLVTQNKFDHCGNPVFGAGCSAAFSSPTQRIQGQAQLIDGWERNSENIGLSVGSDPNSLNLSMANEATIFNMIFRNAPNWAHRDNFMQEMADNFGTAGQEGFLGVGEKQAATYNPFNTAGMTAGKVLVYQVYDPKLNASNSFSMVTIPNADTAKYYRIVAKHNNKVICVAGAGMLSGSAIAQCVFSNAENQKWKIEPTTDGYVQLKAKHSGQAMDVRWGGLRQGTRINQWSSTASSKSQEWKLMPTGNGYFKIINRNSGQALTVPINSDIENLQLVQLQNTVFYSQLWQIVEVSN